jgi:hypothetical protein
MEAAHGNPNRQLIHALLRSRLFRDYENVVLRRGSADLARRRTTEEKRSTKDAL